jgi:hypothetical protein
MPSWQLADMFPGLSDALARQPNLPTFTFVARLPWKQYLHTAQTESEISRCNESTYLVITIASRTHRIYSEFLL